MALTAKQQRFAAEYLVDLNATQAATRAGYSARTARQVGHELLRHPGIAEAIAAGQASRTTRTEITQDMVLQELGRIAFADPRKVMSWGPDGVVLRDSSELTDGEAALVGEVAETKDGIRLKTAPKVTALELLGRHLGMWKEKVEVDASDRLADVLAAIDGRTRGIPGG